MNYKLPKHPARGDVYHHGGATRVVLDVHDPYGDDGAYVVWHRPGSARLMVSWFYCWREWVLSGAALEAVKPSAATVKAGAA